MAIHQLDLVSVPVAVMGGGCVAMSLLVTITHS